MLLICRVAFFCIYLFQLHSLQFILAECLIRLLKNYTGNWNGRLQWIIFYLNLEVHVFPLSEGIGRRKDLVTYVKWIWKPLASGGQPSPKLTPTLFTGSHMPEKGILTRTYFARSQVPDCPDVTRKINSRPGINIYAPLQYIYLLYKDKRKKHFLGIIINLFQVPKKSYKFKLNICIFIIREDESMYT